MNIAVFHLVSGDAFFSGLTIVFLGALLLGSRTSLLRRIGTLCISAGWILVIASAIPLPPAMYAVLAGFSVLAIYDPRKRKAEAEQSQNSTAIDSESDGIAFCWILAAVSLGAIAFEARHHPTMSATTRIARSVHIIGDSLSAGIGASGETPWPQLLNAETKCDVVSHAIAGATSRTAIKQAEGLPDECLVIVEIGGNDLLSGLPSSGFRTDLDQLLALACGPQREVVMFELPLPPLCNGYGYAQRELAARYGVSLIPRRLLAAVLSGQDSTLDSIHLSADGYRVLATRVAEFLRLPLAAPPEDS